MAVPDKNRRLGTKRQSGQRASAIQHYVTTKAKEAPETSPEAILYNPSIQQTIPVTVTKTISRAGKRVLQHIRLTHTLDPLSNDRYFELEAELAKLRVKSLSTEMFAPKTNLWRELAQKVTGYPPNAYGDWRDGVPVPDQVCVVDAVLGTKILDESEIEMDIETETVEEVTEMMADDATMIPFRAMFSGALISNMSHSFRTPSKADMDEFLSIESNEPDRNQMASAERRSAAERFYQLGKRLLAGTEGYIEGADMPAWHLAGTVRTFMLRELGRMGKSLSL